jgi:RNA polymerase sigma-70 factor (ECF subfamily)
MDQIERDQRLSRIATLWSVVFQAHRGEPDDAGTQARNQLMMRYSGAAYRYLLGAVRDAEAASDLCQEFAVRFLRGDFHRADPERGRFRDYLKSALVNLVNDFHRRRQADPRPLPADVHAAPPPDLPSGTDFLAGWREELLDLTWKSLLQANPTYHAALLLRIESPDMPSPQMAEQLSAKLGKPMTAENVRKTLQRAHERFADLLIDQVADSLPGAPPRLVAVHANPKCERSVRQKTTRAHRIRVESTSLEHGPITPIKIVTATVTPAVQACERPARP